MTQGVQESCPEFYNKQSHSIRIIYWVYQENSFDRLLYFAAWSEEVIMEFSAECILLLFPPNSLCLVQHVDYCFCFEKRNLICNVV